MIEVTNENFEEQVLKNEKLVLIDFWAPWCNPCKMMSNIIDELSEEYSDKINICKINIEDFSFSDLPKDFHVSAIPTLLFVKSGDVIKREVGFKTKESISSLIEENL